jgi:hypothetical protein
MLQFKYKDEPMIPVRLHGKEIRLTELMVIDSGSTVSYIPRDTAEKLGISMESQPVPCKGMSGGFDAVESALTIAISKGSHLQKFELPVLVPTDPKIEYFVLGREGFFSRFEITFKHGKKKITLKPAATP